ncbi:hypothetical protein BH10ACT10_BH10ACT10_25740 [soil metagenome]
MTSTVDTGSEPRDLPSGGVLSAVADRRRAADRAEAEILTLAVHWVDLHPVTDESATCLGGVGTPGVE